MAGAGRALLELDLARGDALRPDDDLPREANQVHGGEFSPRPVIAIVIKHAQASRLELLVKALARRIGRDVARLDVDEADFERRHGLRPDDAGRVVRRLDDGGDQPRHSYASRT